MSQQADDKINSSLFCGDINSDFDSETEIAWPDTTGALDTGCPKQSPYFYILKLCSIHVTGPHESLFRVATLISVRIPRNSVAKCIDKKKMSF